MDKLNRSPLNEAETHIKKLESFLEAAQGEFDGQEEERQSVVDTLEYSVIILRQHYKNLLHCMAIAEKTHKT